MEESPTSSLTPDWFKIILESLVLSSKSARQSRCRLSVQRNGLTMELHHCHRVKQV